MTLSATTNQIPKAVKATVSFDYYVNAKARAARERYTVGWGWYSFSLDHILDGGEEARTIPQLRSLLKALYTMAPSDQQDRCDATLDAWFNRMFEVNAPRDNAGIRNMIELLDKQRTAEAELVVINTTTATIKKQLQAAIRTTERSIRNLQYTAPGWKRRQRLEKMYAAYHSARGRYAPSAPSLAQLI